MLESREKISVLEYLCVESGENIGVGIRRKNIGVGISVLELGEKYRC